MQPIRRTGPLSFAVLCLALGASLLGVPGIAHGAPIKPAALRVIVDAGHGGIYSGATYGGVQEADINLSIAKRLATELERRGIDARLTRSSDSRVYRGGSVRTWRFDEGTKLYRYIYWPVKDAEDRLRLDLQSRVDAANASGADLFISIHNNAAGSSAHGIEVWRAPNDSLGQRFGQDVQSHVIRTTGAANRGVHTASFYVVRWSNVPAVLAETGFLSNSAERARLRSSSYQTKLARGMADGIQAFAARSVNEPYQRYWGATRYDTAASVSAAGWPADVPAVVLASGATFSDALVAGPLATKLGGPIVTTSGSGLTPSVVRELGRLAPRRIVVVGNRTSVPDAVAAQAAVAAGLRSADIERIDGADRYEVSLAVARQVVTAETTSVVVASGTGFADSLSIVASAAERGEPILLASPQGLSDGALQLIRERPDRTVTVIGGTTIMPTSVMRGVPFTRLAGKDRYATNWVVFNARYSAAKRTSPILVSGVQFADALVAGPLAASDGRPLVLVGKATVSQDLRPWVYANRNVAMDVGVVGGPAVVTAYVSAMFDKMEMRTY